MAVTSATALDGDDDYSQGIDLNGFFKREEVTECVEIFVDVEEPLDFRLHAGMTAVRALVPGRPDDAIELLCVGRNLASILQTAAAAVAACVPPPAGSRVAAAPSLPLMEQQAALAWVCLLLLKSITITAVGSSEVCRRGARHVLDLARLLMSEVGARALTEHFSLPLTVKLAPILELLNNLLLHCKWESLLHTFVPHGLLPVLLKLITYAPEGRIQDPSQAFGCVFLVMEKVHLRRESAEAQELITTLREMPFLPRYLEAITAFLSRGDAAFRDPDEYFVAEAVLQATTDIVLWCGGWLQLQQTPDVLARFLALLDVMRTHDFVHKGLREVLVDNNLNGIFERCLAGAPESEEKFELGAKVPLSKSVRKQERKDVGKGGVPRCCSHCLRAAAEVQLVTCGRCRITRYCDAQCQRRDWRTHKLVCTKADAPSSA